MRTLRRLQDERGVALIFSMAVMVVLAMTTVGVITYTSSNQRHANRSGAQQVALNLAEAGINNAQSVLGHDDANALSAATLTEPADVFCPDGQNCFEQYYEGGRVLWRGDFTEDASGGWWTLHSWGLVPNPTPGASEVVRYLRATVSIVPNPAQPQNATAWNYVIGWGTSDPNACDMIIYNSASIHASLYIEGNLCLRNSSKIYQPDDNDPVNLVVKGKLEVEQGTQSNKTKVGDSSNPADYIDRAEIGGCTTSITAAAHECSWSTNQDRVWATTLVNGGSTSIERPVSDFEGWYENSNPGPLHACNPASSQPLFDNDTTLLPTGNGSAGVVDLTPATSYSCIGRDGTGMKVGEITWDASSKTLTVSGVMYIDGSVVIDDGVLVKYSGHATLYLTGTLTVSGGTTRLCAAWSGTDCDFDSWDPNANMLIFVARGDDGNGNGIVFSNSVQFQGGLFAENTIDLGQSAKVEGPMIGRTVKLANSVEIKPLPAINTLPLGAPGNPNTHATPQKPVYTG